MAEASAATTIHFPLPKKFVICGTAREAERGCRGAIHCALVDGGFLSQGAMNCAPTPHSASQAVPHITKLLGKGKYIVMAALLLP